jgi:hypothetical protein
VEAGAAAAADVAQAAVVAGAAALAAVAVVAADAAAAGVAAGEAAASGAAAFGSRSSATGPTTAACGDAGTDTSVNRSYAIAAGRRAGCFRFRITPLPLLSIVVKCDDVSH